VLVTGSGTYKIGGEFALLQQLALDLQFDGAEVRHLESSLAPIAAPFPEIKVTVSTTNTLCFASAFSLAASAAPTLRPRLGLAGTNAIVLAWPASAVAFALQQSSDLTATNWTPMTNAPTVVGQENQVTLTRPPGNRFYRLTPH
jgi:hypothetical protein